MFRRHAYCLNLNDMKKILSVTLVLFFSIGFILKADKVHAQGAAVSFQIFYDQL